LASAATLFLVFSRPANSCFTFSAIAPVSTLYVAAAAL
jgi:hypothetical protein